MGHYHLMFWICLPITLFCVFGFCRQDGLWGVLVKIFCLFFAYVIALNYFEPLANLFDRIVLPLAYYNDMWAFLILFVTVLFIEIFLTNRFSRVNLEFPPKTNVVGGMVLLSVVFFLVYGLAAQTLYYTLPEAPSYTSVPDVIPNPPQFIAVGFISSGSLAPISGENRFEFNTLFVHQMTRRAAVYSSVFRDMMSSSSGSQKPSWQFSGNSSPNLQE